MRSQSYYEKVEKYSAVYFRLTPYLVFGPYFIRGFKNLSYLRKLLGLGGNRRSHLFSHCSGGDRMVWPGTGKI